MQIRFIGCWLLGLAALTLSACTTTTTPTMQLIHGGSVGKTYNNLGTITVNQFLDQRSNSEQVNHSTSSQLMPFAYGIVYSGQTIPSIPQYLQQSISQEAQQTGIFTPAKNTGQYTMSGNITSLYVSYKGEAINLPVTLNGNSTPVTLGGYPSFTAVVKYHVDIYQGNQRVFSKNVDETYTQKVYTDMSGASAQDISSQAQAVLDQTVTRSIKDLFDSISAAGL